jgi:16S rRNA (uracil1498-N3)-methyltransferase
VQRRVHTPRLTIGRIDLPPAQARHLRDVLRLKVGQTVEAFDDTGAAAQATIAAVTAGGVTLNIQTIAPAAGRNFSWTIAAAIPKGQRADWMIEKLAELGTAEFVPLIAARSVTLPEGKEKTARWTRLATEASRQSGRTDVMRIGPLTPVADFAAGQPHAWYLSPTGATPIARLTAGARPALCVMLIGPEGGWTEEEVSLFQSRGLIAVMLGRTVLRVETAAVAVAAVAAMWGESRGLRTED